MKLPAFRGAAPGGLPALISGMVFWGMVLVGLVAVILISAEKENNLGSQLELNAQLLASAIEKLLEHNPHRYPLIKNQNAIIDLVEEEMPQRGFLGVGLASENNTLNVGESSEQADVLELVLFVNTDSEQISESRIDLYFYHPDLDALLLQKRNQLFLSIGGTVFLFAFILQMILQRVLSKPMMDMVQVASRFSTGETQLRFDVSSRNELGYMARFINAALEKILQEQRATERALEQLSESQLALREQHDQLEIRVKERTEELSIANKELEAYSYSIAHDLRQPLRAIDGFSQLLFEDYDELLDEDGKDYIARVRSAAQRMGRLIDDILELSKITRADIVFSEVDLSAEAGHILRRLQDANPQRQVELKIQAGLTGTGDRALLRVILENLLGNAWKYSATMETACIEFAAEQEDDCLVYHIRDNGIGFDEAYTDKLFRPFERLHSDERFEGTGIGLATAARAVERMEGTIWAESSLGNGAVFYFTLNRCLSQQLGSGR